MKAINLNSNIDVESKFIDSVITKTAPDDVAFKGKRNKFLLALKNKWFLSIAGFLTFSILFAIGYLIVQQSTADLSNEGNEPQTSSHYILTPTSAGNVLFSSGNEVISFDGTDNPIVDLRSTIQCVQGNNPRSFSFMIQTSSTSNSYILSTGSAGHYNSFMVCFNCGDAADVGRIAVEIWGGWYTPSTMNKIINDGLWHTVLITYDGTTILIYVDGILDNTVTNWNSGGNTATIASTLNTVGNSGNYLGQHVVDGLHRWTGKLKNVMFFDYAVANPVNITTAPSMYPTIAPIVDYLTVKEAKQFKEKLIKYVTNETKKIIKKLEEEFESFKDKQEKIIKELQEELNNLKEK